MIKTTKNKIQILDLLETYLHLTSFAFLGYVFLPFFIMTPSFEEPYGILTRIGIILFLAIFALSLAITLKTNVSALLKNTVRTISAFSNLAALYVLFGALQDAMHVHCVGFFGATTNCLDSAALSASFVGFNPATFLPLAILLIALLVLGIWQSFYTSSAPKK